MISRLVSHFFVVRLYGRWLKKERHGTIVDLILYACKKRGYIEERMTMENERKDLNIKLFLLMMK